jgi:type II secretory pathway predicted ATPase ExeA
MLSYFSLTALPFTKEISTDQLQRLPSVERNLSAAQLLVETRGIGVITGKAGTGKSSLLRLLCQSLPAGLFKPYYICHSSVGIVEFYTHLVTAFGLESCYRRAAMFRDFKDHVLSMNTTSHIHPVLLVDEAHLLNNDILAEIRLLTNYQIDSLNALSVILCGAESLNRKFGLSMLEALANSITITISVDSLAKEETFSYIESRLSACGAKTPLMTKPAMELIHQAAGGIMRTIGTIANAALMKAYMAKSQQTEAEHVQAVIQR